VPGPKSGSAAQEGRKERGSLNTSITKGRTASAEREIRSGKVDSIRTDKLEERGGF